MWPAPRTANKLFGVWRRAVCASSMAHVMRTGNVQRIASARSLVAVPAAIRSDGRSRVTGRAVEWPRADGRGRRGKSGDRARKVVRMAWRGRSAAIMHSHRSPPNSNVRQKAHNETRLERWEREKESAAWSCAALSRPPPPRE